MRVNRSVSPVPWGDVALVVIPGLLFGVSRWIGPLGLPAGLSFLLVAVLASGVLVVHRRLPVWGLLALGLFTSWALQWISLQLPEELIQILLGIPLAITNEAAIQLILSTTLQRLILAAPVWLLTIWLLWTYRPLWRKAAWAIVLFGLVVVGASILAGDPISLLYTGLVLLSVTLGLPLSRRYGSLASLFVLGVFSSLLLSDSDYYSGSLLNSQPLYPLYVVPLVWMLVSIAPLLLLRAQTLRGQAAGLLAPALVWGTARIIVPLLVRPDFHPLSVWLGDALGSVFVLFVLALSFYLYSQGAHPIPPSREVQVGPAVYN